MVQGETYDCVSKDAQTFISARRASSQSIFDGLLDVSKDLHGNCSKQRAAILEMVCGRRMCDTRATRDIPNRYGVDTRFIQGRQSGNRQRVA